MKFDKYYIGKEKEQPIVEAKVNMEDLDMGKTYTAEQLKKIGIDVNKIKFGKAEDEMEDYGVIETGGMEYYFEKRGRKYYYDGWGSVVGGKKEIKSMIKEAEKTGNAGEWTFDKIADLEGEISSLTKELEAETDGNKRKELTLEIERIQAKKEGLEKGMDKKEQRHKTDKKEFEITEECNCELMMDNIKKMIEKLPKDDPRTLEYKRRIDEIGDVSGRKGDKDLNKELKKLDEDICQITKEKKLVDTETKKVFDRKTMDKLAAGIHKGKVLKIAVSNIMDVFQQEMEDLKSDVQTKDITKEEAKKLANDIIKSVIERLKNKIKAELDIIETEENEPEPEPTLEPKADIWEISEGIPLGNGYMAHKDKEKNEIYVIDKDGAETYRFPNAFSNDMAMIIEFFRVLLELPMDKKEAPEAAPEAQEEVVEDKEEKEEDKTNEELDKELDKMLEKKEKESKPEVSESEIQQNEKLADLKKQIDEKKKKVEEILTYMIENNKLVDKADIQAEIIKGENAIFARKRAIEKKMKVKRKTLMAADDDMLDTLMISVKGENKQQAENIIAKLFQK